MPMTRALSPELVDYLRRCGFSSREIAKWDLHMRVYHDLGWYGDIAEGCMDELVDHDHVDMSGFEFDRFFPPEFLADDFASVLWYGFVPFAAERERNRRVYEPLTLKMIESAFRTGRWT